MGNKFLTLIIAFCYSIVFGSIELSFNNYSESNGTADVVYSSSVEIGGFQIGLFNWAGNANGIQFGLVNFIKENPKWCRVLPIINMRFKK